MRRQALKLLVPLIAAITVAGSFAIAPAQARTHAPTKVAAAKVKGGAAHILLTKKGMTLYVFASDPKDKSTCEGQCAQFWPPLLVSSNANPAPTVKGVVGTFGTITRSDGTRQLTFDGAPLYTFVQDKKPGDMHGQGVVASGGYWWAVVCRGK